MSYLFRISYIIAEVVLFFSIVNWIAYGKIENSIMKKIFCFLLMVMMETILDILTLKKVITVEETYRNAMYIFISITCLFLYLCLVGKKSRYLYNFSMAISTVLIDMMCLVVLSMLCSYLCFCILKENNIIIGRIVLVFAYVILSTCISLWKRKIPLYKLFDNRGIRIISVIAGIFLIILQQLGIHLFKNDYYNFSIIVANIFIFLIIFSVLWLLDHYRLAAGKLKVEQDNRKMNSNLHKTKELMPLLISVVNENEGLLDPQLVEEFNQIYSEQMITGREENMNYKLLGTTGIKLLDLQLQHYILECSRKGIVMDVFASEPIGKQLHEMHIAQLMMHNVMGDLLRNAIRAIERSGRTDGKILVILGKKEGIVELDIFDNGDEIPFSILEKFGKRGLTTGGTGNGLADIAEMLKDYKISLVIKENESGSSTYVKGFMLVFDGKNRRELRTCRSGKEKLKKIGYWTVVSEEAFGEKEG